MSPPLPYRSRQKLTEALPTTDGEVLRTIGDAISYMTALPKQWQLQQTWQHACKLILGRAPVILPTALIASTTLASWCHPSSANAQTPHTAPRQSGGSAAQIMSSIPSNSVTITHWYKQSVYDPSHNKIGEIMDVLVDREGKATAFIIGVGGFLGMGEKDVAVPFNAVQVTTKDNNKWYLVMNSNKDALKNAKGFKYDRNEMTWKPE
jgi:sporulation protein YlmC with PRC-barrel domain